MNLALKVLAAIAAIVTIVAGVHAALARHGHSSDPALSASSANFSASSASASVSSAAGKGAGGFAIGDCADEDQQPVSCSLAHTFEVFSKQGCDGASLLAYLGGDVGLDTLLPSVLSSGISRAGDGACLVTVPSSAANDRSNRSALTTTAGDGWRECLAGGDPNYTMTSCAQPHRAEVVYSGPASAEAALDCQARANAYLNTDMTTAPSDLLVTTLRQGNTAQCLVSLRSDNQLTASLRRLGTQNLPIAPS